MAEPRSFLDAVLGVVVDAVSPIADALEDPLALTGLLDELGWSLEDGAVDAGDLGTAFPVGPAIGVARQALETYRADGDPSAEDLAQLVAAVAEMVTALGKAPGAPPASLPAPLGDAVFWQQLSADLVAHLFATHLSVRKPLLFSLLRD